MRSRQDGLRSRAQGIGTCCVAGHELDVIWPWNVLISTAHVPSRPLRLVAQEMPLITLQSSMDLSSIKRERTLPYMYECEMHLMN